MTGPLLLWRQVLAVCGHLQDKRARPESELFRPDGNPTWTEKGTTSIAFPVPPRSLVLKPQSIGRWPLFS